MPVFVSCLRCHNEAEIADSALASDIPCPVCAATMPILQWVEAVSISDLTNVTIAREAVEIRRRRRIRLPDALIWASARAQSALLATRNTKDFPPDEPGIRRPY